MAIKSSEVATKLRTMLQEGKVQFVFKKKDGSRRPAVGTLNLDLIPEADKQFKTDGQDKEPSQTCVTYYDLEKMAWRCCKAENILEIEGEEVCDD